MKQYRALAALITSKKGLEHPRIRVFATLYGLSSHAGEEGQGYKAEYVDFFFQQILPNVFASAKQVNAILGAKGHSDIDLDKFLKRMENIFPNFLKKDGFKYMVLEDKIEKKMSRKTKGIEMVDADDVIECLINHWQQEIILCSDRISWDTMRLLKNFQQRAKAILRQRKAEHEAEHKLEEKWTAMYGDVVPDDCEAAKAWMRESSINLKEGVGEESLQEVMDKMVSYYEKKKKMEKRVRKTESDVKTTALTIPQVRVVGRCARRGMERFVKSQTLRCPSPTLTPSLSRFASISSPQYFAVTMWRMKLLDTPSAAPIDSLKASHPHRRTHASSLVMHSHGHGVPPL